MSANTKFRSNEKREEANVEEFIPFACHYDPSTLLTKNGELLQTIKIVGFTFECVNQGDQSLSLRAAIRKSVLENVKTGDYALWFHTVRRKKDLTTNGVYPEGGFADHLNKSWCEKHDWEHKYVNELYVTIIRQGQDFGLDFGSFFRSLAFGAERKFREKYLDYSFSELNSTVERVLASLEEYGARRLTMMERGGIVYSEPLQFFGKILNLKETPMPVPIMDISEYLPTHRTLFGYNALEVVGETGRHFGAILSLKEYHEVTSSAIDEFLQLDQQFVITETFDFVNNEFVQKKFEHQRNILRLSGDNTYAKVSGIEDMANSHRNLPTDYGEHQITIMLVEDDMDMLEAETVKILDAFHELGIVVIREDVMMEECFWAQLPGNFEFLRRLSPINTSKIGGFASLYNFPAGKLDNNHWGDAVTVFYTKANTPYFFNFHDEGNGHTTIIGPYGAGKTVLLNFLVSESIKYNPKIFFFDQHRGSELFIKALGGKYQRVLKDGRSKQTCFNPLRLPDSEENRGFLKLWLYYLMMDEEYVLPEAVVEQLAQAIEYNYTLPEGERQLSNIAAKFWPVTDVEVEKQKEIEIEQQKQIVEKADLQSLLRTASEDQEVTEEERVPLPQTPEGRLSYWYGEGKFAHLFDNQEDEFNLDDIVNGFDVTEIVQEKWPVIPVISYMLHKIKGSLDNTPTIIVLDEAWRLVDNPIFAPKLAEWLDELESKNAMVIFATESVDDASNSSITDNLMGKIATQIYLPNDGATPVYKDVFGLSDKEYDLLNDMNAKERNFLLKHHGDAVVAKLNLAGMEGIVSILSGKRENIALVESIILEHGAESHKWLPVFYDRFKK